MTRKHDLWKMADVKALTGCTADDLYQMRKHRVLPIKGRWYSDEDVALIEIAQQLRAGGQKWRAIAAACWTLDMIGREMGAAPRTLTVCPVQGLAWGNLTPEQVNARVDCKHNVLIWIDIETTLKPLREAMDARRAEMDSVSTHGRRGARVPNNSRTASDGAA